MSLSVKSVDAITLFVADLPRAKAFYRDRLGLRLVFEDASSAAFDVAGTIVNLLIESSAHELIAPAVVAPGGGGARAQFTLGVTDTDAACAELGEAGVTLVNGPIDRPWGLRTAAFSDPDGNIWELAQNL